jgi:hypothetical protein
MLLSERVGASGEPNQSQKTGLRIVLKAKQDRALIIKNLGSTVAYINKNFGDRGLLKKKTSGGNRGGYPRLR